MIHDFGEHIQENFPYLFDSKILVAISGGLDSVVLTHLCREIGLEIELAHCNFKLRGAESDTDEEFVRNMASDLGLKCHVNEFLTENYAAERKISIQMAARELRYDWFEMLSDKEELDYVLTAHHADDNLETLLINLGRGTGLEGLTGIPERNGDLVRPMLPFSREEILIYAKSKGIKWVEDSSNAETKYLRNKLRHTVIPQLKESHPEFLSNVIRTIQNLKDVQLIVSDRIKDLKGDGLVQNSENGLKIDIDILKKTDHPKPYLYYLLEDFGFTEWDAIERLLDAQSGKQMFSQGWRLIKDRNSLLLEPIDDDQDVNIDIDIEDDEVDTPTGILKIDEVDEIQGNGKADYSVDKDKLRFPLTLRRWEDGDWFQPFGMMGKKKISKYFKDEKISLPDKDHIWLLCSGEDVVWVVGRRGDERFKVTDDTAHILKFSWLPHED